MVGIPQGFLRKPDGSEGEYHYVHTPGSVMIVPITDKGKIVLVRQYRYLNQREGLEFIGGGMKAALSAEESAREELLEEAGIIAGELIRIGEFNPFNGVTDEICNIFVARSLKKGAAKPEATEEFEVVELDYTKFCELVIAGSIWDGMTLAAFAFFEQRKQEFLLTTTE
jgi:ADP-ribose pyrophosphatase